MTIDIIKKLLDTAREAIEAAEQSREKNQELVELLEAQMLSQLYFKDPNASKLQVLLENYSVKVETPKKPYDIYNREQYRQGYLNDECVAGGGCEGEGVVYCSVEESCDCCSYDESMPCPDCNPDGVDWYIAAGPTSGGALEWNRSTPDV